MNRTIFGSVETVTLPELRCEATAKVDTGAWSCSLHCTNIRVEDGVLYFTPVGDKSLTTSTTNYSERVVKSSNGHEERRYVVGMRAAINGVEYELDISLSNRKRMTREMLIGRKFLIENKILVDVNQTLERDTEAEMYL